jgi:DNA (cytosine-5)-methyltransferase 1
MPILRSGLSKEEDGTERWRVVASEAMLIAAKACAADSSWLKSVGKLLHDKSAEIASLQFIPGRESITLTDVRDNRLAAWLSDPGLNILPNHEARGHMRADLARYAFVAAFGEVFDRSPKATEFPEKLAPDHGNWKSGKFADRFRVQLWKRPATTITSHISKDGHYFIHPDLIQCRSLTVREAARLQTFPDNYFFEGNRTQQFVQVGNAVPPLMARQIAMALLKLLQSEPKTKQDLTTAAA